MNLIKANQIVAHYQTEHVIEKYNKMDYSVFNYKHFELVDDFCLGENKQKLKLSNGKHMFMEKMDIIYAASELKQAFLVISRSNNWSFPESRFKFVIDKFQENFKQYLNHGMFSL